MTLVHFRRSVYIPYFHSVPKDALEATLHSSYKLARETERFKCPKWNQRISFDRFGLCLNLDTELLALQVVFRRKYKHRTCIQMYNIKGLRRPRTYIKVSSFSLFTDDGARRYRRFLAAFKIPQVCGAQSLLRWSGKEFMGWRTDLRPLSPMSVVTLAGHPLPRSTGRKIETTSTCSCANPSCGNRFCLLSCAWRGGSGTRSWLASRTGWGKWRSLCVGVLTGTCWKWIPFPTPGVAYWWRRCACACCCEVGCCYFLLERNNILATYIIT